MTGKVETVTVFADKAGQALAILEPLAAARPESWHAAAYRQIERAIHRGNLTGHDAQLVRTVLRTKESGK